MKTELLVLKSKLCGLEHTSRKLRKRIAKSKGPRRWTLRFNKHTLGLHTREHLIAYGLLRNVSYERIENKCALDNAPNVDRITEIVQQHVPYWERKNWQRTKIESLLIRAEK